VLVTWSTHGQEGWQVLELAGTDPSVLTAARRWVEGRLTTLSANDRLDTMLVVEELLENAYRHAGGPGQLRIHHAHDPCEVTVAVADAGAGEPRMRVPDHRGGRGLLVVDQVCAEWGVSTHDDGKLVWGRVDCDDPGSS
jgi:anti-sigma regulatory factor (Ser/Thr protein kinase)